MNKELRSKIVELIKATDLEMINLAFAIIEENCDTFADFNYFRMVAEVYRWPQDDEWKERGMNREEYTRFSFVTEACVHTWKKVDKRVKEHGGRCKTQDRRITEERK